jgi:hypothetical protein
MTTEQNMPEHKQPATHAATSMWWLSPMGLVVGFLVPVFLSIASIGFLNLETLQIRGVRFVNTYWLIIGMLLLACVAIGAWAGQLINLKPHGNVLERRWERVLWVLGLIGVGAYIVWFKEIWFSPSTLLGVLTGRISMSRSELGNAPGVTSLVNVLPVYFTLATYVACNARERFTKPLWWLTGILTFLTLFRVYVWAERLALIEVTMAAALPFSLHVYRTTPRRWLRQLLLLGPMIGLPMLVLYFGAAEYFRSWQSDTYKGKFSFWGFAIGRLGSYYYTSINNGVGVLETFSWPTYKFENALNFLYKAPMSVGPIFAYMMGLRSFSFGEFLGTFGDPEFNNPSGLYAIVFDAGISGAIYYYVLSGFACGVLYRSFTSGGARGLFLYPACFVMMLEVYRYPYFGTSRAFTTFLGAMLALWLLGSSIRKKQ